jgi:GAF domain-containing protein
MSYSSAEDAKVAQLTRELSEAREQQAAVSEILQVVSKLSGDLQPAFTMILKNAVDICSATFGNIYLWDGNRLKATASLNTPAAFAEARERLSFIPGANNPLARMIATGEVIHLPDVIASEAFAERDPPTVAAVELGGVRTLLVVPMLKDNVLIGALTLARQEVQPFSGRQIALVQNFASQGVIAIENARLLKGLRQLLEQQTATSDVLKVVSGSSGELQAVFDAIIENATRLCQASLGTMAVYEEGGFRHVKLHGAPPAYMEAVRQTPLLLPKPGAPLDRVAKTKQYVHIPDYLQYPPEIQGRLAKMAGARTLLIVPMLKDQTLIGIIGVYRQEVRPFSEDQIALMQNFATQAVVAIENARLLNELRQSLDQQKATSEVLQVISSFPGDLEPVFARMLEKAVTICEARFGNIQHWDGEALHLVAAHNTPPAFAEARRRSPNRPSPNSSFGRMIATKTVVHVANAAEQPGYTKERDPASVDAVELGGVRTALYVPMLKENELVGAFTLSRQEVRPFTEEQISLVKSFAAQAVVAIENARLLKELRERTQEVEKLNQQLEQRVADQVGEIERMSRLRRFLPPQVADLIVASGSEKQLESHRREITALFCDLRGFTGFTESADAEDVMALLRDYHAAIGEIIIKYNGTLERYAGDGVMVVFNDPVPVENPALQAVLMALEVRDAIGALTERWRRWGHDIGFGIGIAHGFATLGTIGFEGRFDYAAIGTVSNVASRLCDEAKPGQILIGPRVLTKVEHAVKVESVGEFELKGIRRPLVAYNVVAAPTKN